MQRTSILSIPARLAASAVLGLLPMTAMAAANLIIVNLDGPNEGFNDPDPVAPVTGNPGTTLGQQRLNVFEAAAQVWEATLNSAVDIRVAARFDPLTPCEPTFAVLGQAGPNTVHRNFTGAGQPGVWYAAALANAQAGSDLSAGNDDISATFNSTLDAGTGCLGNSGWDYRIPASGSSLSLYSVVLHEIGHGLNFLTFTDGGDGSFFAGAPDIYATFLYDKGQSRAWTDMTDAQRAASAVGGQLYWSGANAKAAAAAIPLTGGRDGATGNVEMYAPNPLASGSSVSHWDTGLNPDELMEPFSTANPLREVTIGAFADMGWPLVGGGEADLQVTKQASSNPVVAGQPLTYTVTVQNAGPDEAVDVVVTDTLPGCVSAPTTSGCDEDPNGVPTCSLGAVAASGGAAYSITVDTTGCPAGLITNQATVASTTPDPAVGNNATSLNTTVDVPIFEADLSIAKTDSPDPVTAGELLVYTVTVHNAGPQEAVNVSVIESLPAGVTFLSTNGCTEDPNGVPGCSLGSIAAGASGQYDITVGIPGTAGGLINNSAQVFSATDDPNPGNDTVVEDTFVNAVQVDLGIEKTASADPAVIGQDLTYSITVTNFGPHGTDGLTVIETLPLCMASSVTSGCAEDPFGEFLCSLEGLAAGESVSFDITVDTSGCVPGFVVNEASTDSGLPDPVPANNSVLLETELIAPTPLEADLAVGLSDLQDPVSPGEVLDYRVTVDNAGPDQAENVSVVATLPADVNFFGTAGCLEDPLGVPTCSLGDVAATGTKQYDIKVTVDAGAQGTLVNSVAVFTTTGDPNSANNLAVENTLVGSPTEKNLDVDANGVADALTDGVLIERYLLGLRGQALIEGAVDQQEGERKTAEEIEAYLASMLP